MPSPGRSSKRRIRHRRPCLADLDVARIYRRDSPVDVLRSGLAQPQRPGLRMRVVHFAQPRSIARSTRASNSMRCSAPTTPSRLRTAAVPTPLLDGNVLVRAELFRFGRKTCCSHSSKLIASAPNACVTTPAGFSASLHKPSFFISDSMPSASPRRLDLFGRGHCLTCPISRLRGFRKSTSPLASLCGDDVNR